MNSKEQILNALNALAGTWNSFGKILASEDSPSSEVAGTDTYEWLPDKQYMIHRADVTVGDDKVDVIEIIGEYDEAKRACTMHAFQNDGSHSVMWANVNEDGSLLFADDVIRATLTLHPDGKTMHAKWERLNDNQWEHWMDMLFAKN
jgi:hypothetical protein